MKKTNITLTEMKEEINEFNLSDIVYIYNCAGDYVADEQGPKLLFDQTKAKELLSLVESLEGAEYAVVINNGVLGVMAEQRFIDPVVGELIEGLVVKKLHPFFRKYNGSGSIKIGIMEEDLKAVWPQLFIPSDTLLHNKRLSNNVTNEFSELLIDIN